MDSSTGCNPSAFSEGRDKEIVDIVTTGYLRQRAIRIRNGGQPEVPDQNSPIEENSQNCLEIPGMSSNCDPAAVYSAENDEPKEG